MEGDLELADQQLQECLALRQETGNLAGQAVALLELAGVAFMSADYESVRARCQEGVAVAQPRFPERHRARAGDALARLPASLTPATRATLALEEIATLAPAL